MKRFSGKSLLGPSSVVLSLGLLTVTVSHQGIGDSNKSSVFVNISSDPVRAHEDIAALAKYELLGVSYDEHYAEVFVTGSELESIKQLGFKINFLPLRPEENKLGPTGYTTPTQLVEKLGAVHAAYPELTRLFEVGRTTRDRPIIGLEITAPGDTEGKPVLLYNAMHHAREVMTTEVALGIIKTLTEGYGSQEEVTAWLDKYRVVVVPQVNPDGNALVHDGQNMWRKNAYMKGNSTVGVDLNRNYPTLWNYCNGSSGSTGSDTYRGPQAGSEPETKAFMNLVATIKPVMDISYHSYSQLIIFPYGCSKVSNPSRELFVSIANTMNAGIRDDSDKPNKYKIGTAPELLYEADGSDLDWQWKEHNVIAYTIEVNSMFQGFQPSYAKWRDVTVQRQEGGWQALLRRMDQGGVKAIVTGENLTEVQYTVKKVTALGLKGLDEDSERRFSLRNEHGLMFQILDPGTYEISFYRGQSVAPVATKQIKIEQQTIDLGSLMLE